MREKLKKRKFDEKGITLIALIITIIIMLILVAVTIDIAVDGKLFDKAQEAVDKTNDKVGQTQDKIDEWMGKLDGTSGDTGSGNTDENTGNSNTDAGSTTVTSLEVNLEILNTETTVTADGTKIKEIKEGAPIPVDFYYVGGTMDTGIVISDSSADANKGDGHDVELEGNQFVWVPVLQNQRIEIRIEASADITSLTIEDPLSNEITTDKNGTTIAPSGTSYTVEVSPTINGEYTVTVQAGEKTITETLDVSTLYAQDFWNMDTESAKNYKDDTIATHTQSVNKYGGFYIARYEAGSATARTSQVNYNVTATVYSKKNMYPYNHINQTNAINKAGGMYNKTNITSSLINAAAWDRTLNWLVETNAITVNDTTNELLNSTSWGNHNNSSFNFTGKYYYSGTWTDVTTSTPKPEDTCYLLGTGISDYTKRNNIYDLAGNCWEWTTEVPDSSNVVYRAGSCYFDGDFYPAGCRLKTSERNWDENTCFRPTLYIN